MSFEDHSTTAPVPSVVNRGPEYQVFLILLLFIYFLERNNNFDKKYFLYLKFQVYFETLNLTGDENLAQIKTGLFV